MGSETEDLMTFDEDYEDTFDPYSPRQLLAHRNTRKYRLIGEEELRRHEAEQEKERREEEDSQRYKRQVEAYLEQVRLHTEEQEQRRREEYRRFFPQASSQEEYRGTRMVYREPREYPPPPTLDGPYTLQGGSRTYQPQRNAGDMHQKRRKPLAMPDMYNGKTSWLDYVAHFESCALLNEWSEEDKVAFLRTRLSGVARRTLKSVLTNAHQTYDQIIAALGNRFEPEDREDLYLSQLRGRRKLADEKLEDLADDIRRLCELAYPTYDFDALERVGRNHFLDAITDSQLRHDISLSGAKTLTRAAQVAAEREAFLEGERARSGTQKVQSISTGKTWDQERQQMQTKIDAMASELKKWKLKANSKQDSRPKVDKSQQPCFYCEKLGHYMFECRKKQADERYQNNPQQQNGYQQQNSGGRGRGGWRGRGRGRGSWRGRGRGRGRGGGNNNFNNMQQDNQAGMQQNGPAPVEANTTEYQEN